VLFEPDRVDFLGRKLHAGPRRITHGLGRPSNAGKCYAPPALPQLPKPQHAPNQQIRFPAENYLSPAWLLSLEMRQLQAGETVPQSRPQEIFP